MENGEKYEIIEQMFTERYGMASNPAMDFALSVEPRLEPTRLVESMKDLQRPFKKTNVDIKAH